MMQLFYFVYFLYILIEWVVVVESHSFTSYVTQFFYNVNDDLEDRDFDFADVKGAVDKRSDGCSNATLILTSCDEHRIMMHLAKMQLISPDRIITLLTSENILIFCAKLQKTITCVSNHFKKCSNLSHENLYLRLYEGARVLNNELCKKSNTLQQYLKLDACYKELHEEYIECEGPADWFEQNKSSICKNAQNIISCNYLKTAALCGKQSAKFMFNLSKKVFSTVLIPHCCISEPFAVTAMPLVADVNKSV